MFYVVQDRVYSATYDALNSRYPLVSISKDANGVITITDEGDGIATLPASFLYCSLNEVVSIFNITSTSEYEPRATITGNEPVTIYLDEASKVVTLTIAKPALGDFSAVASSAVAVATVSEADSAFTIVPVAVGTCNITATWTPTDTDFAASSVVIPVTVVKRQIEFVPVRDQSLTKAVDKTIVLQPNVGTGSTLVYTVFSTDTAICSPAITGTADHENDLVLTVPDATPLGVATISVFATDSNAKASDSAVITFNVRGCNSAVTITAIADLDITAGTSKEITVTCAGATIREVTTSDATHVTAEITAPLKFKINAVGAAVDTATITVYCDKFGYGEDDEALTATLV